MKTETIDPRGDPEADLQIAEENAKEPPATVTRMIESIALPGDDPEAELRNADESTKDQMNIATAEDAQEAGHPRDPGDKFKWTLLVPLFCMHSVSNIV